MKYTKFILLALLTTASLAKAQDRGGNGSGGGRGVVCRSTDGSVKTAELLDLYEGRVQFGWKTIDDTRPFRQQYLDAAARVGTSRNWATQARPWSEMLQIQSDDTFKIFSFVTDPLSPIDDSFETVKPPTGCKIEQVAQYLTSNVLVNKPIWDAMNETSKAALVLHETLYHDARVGKEFNSIRMRRLVALGFARYPFIELFTPEQFGGNSVECYSPVEQNKNSYVSSLRVIFFINSDPAYPLHMRIEAAGNREQFVKSQLDLPGQMSNSDFKFWSGLTLTSNGADENGAPTFHTKAKFNDLVDNDLGGYEFGWKMSEGKYKFWMRTLSEAEFNSNGSTSRAMGHQDRLECRLGFFGYPDHPDRPSREDWNQFFKVSNPDSSLTATDNF